MESSQKLRQQRCKRFEEQLKKMHPEFFKHEVKKEEPSKEVVEPPKEVVEEKKPVNKFKKK